MIYTRKKWLSLLFLSFLLFSCCALLLSTTALAQDEGEESADAPAEDGGAEDLSLSADGSADDQFTDDASLSADGGDLDVSADDNSLSLDDNDNSSETRKKDSNRQPAYAAAASALQSELKYTHAHILKLASCSDQALAYTRDTVNHLLSLAEELVRTRAEIARLQIIVNGTLGKPEMNTLNATISKCSQENVGDLRSIRSLQREKKDAEQSLPICVRERDQLNTQYNELRALPTEKARCVEDKIQAEKKKDNFELEVTNFKAQISSMKTERDNLMKDLKNCQDANAGSTQGANLFTKCNDEKNSIESQIQAISKDQEISKQLQQCKQDQNQAVSNLEKELQQCQTSLPKSDNLPYKAIGCFADAHNRDLPVHAGSGSHFGTREKCHDECRKKGFKYFGLQYHDQCFCGDKYGSHGVRPDTECHLKCHHNHQQICGGTWRNSIFEILNPLKPNENTPHTFIGCYKDQKDRDLPVFTGNNFASVEKCHEECKKRGNKYFGLQDGNQCFCGQSFGKYGLAENNDCHKKCAGNHHQKCGGHWRNSIYKINH